MLDPYTTVANIIGGDIPGGSGWGVSLREVEGFSACLEQGRGFASKLLPQATPMQMWLGEGSIPPSLFPNDTGIMPAA